MIEMNSEDRLLASLIPQLPQFEPVIWGPGDDAALLYATHADEDRLLTVDQVIMGVHFTTDTPAELVAQKLVRRNISDIAAMGGIPESALLSIAIHLPEATQNEWLSRFYQGLRDESNFWHFSICGGDISVLPQAGVVASLSLHGVIPHNQSIARNTAQPGDLLFVTGEFGRSFVSGHHLHFIPALPEGQRLREYQIPSAMMDVSDGLLTDLARMCCGAKLGAQIHTDQIPRRQNATLKEALNDGEDYELLFTVPPAKVAQLHEIWSFATPLTQIGTMIETQKILDSAENVLIPGGWDPLKNNV